MDKKTLDKTKGEHRREASRQRDLREFQNAVNKGYDNKAIRERMKK